MFQLEEGVERIQTVRWSLLETREALMPEKEENKEAICQGDNF
jgi:hypothetical protein